MMPLPCSAYLIGHIMWPDSPCALSIQVPLLQQVGDSVVRHVDGGVRQGLNEVGWVAGQACAQSKGPAASPLVQPAQGILEAVAGVVCV